MPHEAKILLAPLLAEDCDVLEEHHSGLYFTHETGKLKDQMVSSVSTMGTPCLLREPLTRWATGEKSEITTRSPNPVQYLGTRELLSIRHYTGSR